MSAVTDGSTPSEQDKAMVKVNHSINKKFRFGGNEVLPALKEVTVPAMLGGKKILITTSVVASQIPLLWSKPSMKKCGVVLDLRNDRAKIFVKWVDMNQTSIGHYSLDILPRENNESTIEENCFINMPNDRREKEQILIKIHHQFGHPGRAIMDKLLKQAHVQQGDK